MLAVMSHPSRVLNLDVKAEALLCQYNSTVCSYIYLYIYIYHLMSISCGYELVITKQWEGHNLLINYTLSKPNRGC